MTLILSGTDGLSDIDGSAATPAIRGTDTNTGIFFPAADTIAFSEGGVESMRIDSSGNVGIGTSSPGTRLHVVSNDNVTNTRLAGASYAFRVQSISSTGTVVDATNNNESTYQPLLIGGSEVRFTITGSERARVDSSGNFLVAKTTTADTTVGAAMLASGRVTSTMSSSLASDSTLHVYSTGAGGYRFYVNMAGTVFATNTTITAISDQRLKENIRNLDAGLPEIMALKPRKFDWKEGKGKDIKDDRGWIAQEFEQVFPDMIEEWKDPAPEGEEPYKSVRADLIPVLVKAIQEQQAIIQSLTARIEALEGK